MNIDYISDLYDLRDLDHAWPLGSVWRVLSVTCLPEDICVACYYRSSCAQDTHRGRKRSRRSAAADHGLSEVSCRAFCPLRCSLPACSLDRSCAKVFCVGRCSTLPLSIPSLCLLYLVIVVLVVGASYDGGGAFWSFFILFVGSHLKTVNQKSVCGRCEMWYSSLKQPKTVHTSTIVATCVASSFSIHTVLLHPPILIALR